MSNTIRKGLVLVLCMGYGNVSLAAEAVVTQSQASSKIPVSALLNWSKQAAVAVYTYTYQNRSEAENGMKMYFSPSGWSKFSAAHHASGNTQIVQAEKMQVRAKVDGHAGIVGQDHSTGRFIFQVNVPLEVTYAGAHYTSRQAMNVDLYVAEQSRTEGEAARFKIEVFKAKVDLDRQHMKDLPSYCKWKKPKATS